MSKTASAAAIGLPISCPVEPLGRQATDLIRAMNAVQTAAFGKSDDERIDLDRVEAALTTRFYGIEHFATHLPAASGAGALFHLGLIGDRADTIENAVPEGSSGKDKARDAHHAIFRMLHSLRNFIESVTGDDATAVAGEFYLSRDLDPHRRVARGQGVAGRVACDDPILELIEAHRRAWDTLDAIDVDDAAWETANPAERAAWDAMITVEPATLAGAAALAKYVAQHPDAEVRDVGSRGIVPVLKSIASAMARFDRPPPPPATPVRAAAPDQELVALGRQMQKAYEAEQEAFRRNEGNNSALANIEIERLSESCEVLAYKIENRRATTLNGLLAKAQALMWRRDSDLFPMDKLPEKADTRAAVGLANDLLAMCHAPGDRA